MTESQRLLAEYAMTGSEPALRDLLTRYLDMVYSAVYYGYAGDHQDQFPTSFDLVASYLEEALKNVLNPGDVLRDKDQFAQVANQFEIVYQGSLNEITNRNSIIVMREKEAWPSATGGWNRTYGFADGHAEVHKADDGNFGPWEAQHLQKKDTS